MALGKFLNLSGPSSLSLWNVGHNPCSASLRRLSSHQMRDCAWKYFARLMLTFRPAKFLWGEWWRPGLRGGVEGGGTPACLRQTAWHVDASTTLLSLYREAASNINGFPWHPSHPTQSVPRVASASCQLTSFHEKTCKQDPLFPGCLQAFPPFTFPPHVSLIYQPCLAFVSWLNLPVDFFSWEKTTSM